LPNADCQLEKSAKYDGDGQLELDGGLGGWCCGEVERFSDESKQTRFKAFADLVVVIAVPKFHS
jgi:hypothetical protein